jgi:hypothetical protein
MTNSNVKAPHSASPTTRGTATHNRTSPKSSAEHELISICASDPKIARKIVLQTNPLERPHFTDPVNACAYGALATLTHEQKSFELQAVRTLLGIWATDKDNPQNALLAFEAAEAINAGKYSINGTPPTFERALELANQIKAAAPKPKPKAGQKGKNNHYELHTFKDLASIPRLLWLIRGLILQCVSSLLSAASGNYKSFIALEMLLCIATGRDFHGREVMQGTSVYVAAEGFYTMYDRASAWAQFHECELPENFYIIKVPVNLADPGVVAVFGQSIADLKPAIVVLDTLSQNAIGANENDNAQMADFVRGMMKLGNDIGAHVMVLHHNAKATGTFRGAGSIAANIDTHISMDRPENDTDNTVFVRCEKQRGKPFEAFALRGQEIELPYADEYGDPITSLVFEECGAEVTAKKEKHASTQRAEKTRDALMEVFDQLAERNGGVKIGSWKEEAIEERERNGLPEICKQAAFWSHVKQLKKEGVIIQCGTHNGSELWARPAATTSTMSTTT